MALLPPDPLFILKSNMGHIHALQFMFKESDVSYLLAANEEGYIYFWNLKTNRCTYKQCLGVSIQAIHYVPPHIVTQEKLGAVKLWDVDPNFNCSLLKEYHCEGGFCHSIVINNCIVLPHANSELEGINLQTFEKIVSYIPMQDKLGYVMALEKANISGTVYVMAGYENGDIILYDFLNGEQSGHVQLQGCITSIAFDSLMGRGVCGNTSNVLQVFTIDKQRTIKLKCEISMKSSGCNVVKLRQDHKILACGGWDGQLRLFSWKTLRLLVVLSQHKSTITDVIFSQKIVPEWSSNVMAVAGGEGGISLWNLYNQ